MIGDLREKFAKTLPYQLLTTNNDLPAEVAVNLFKHLRYTDCQLSLLQLEAYLSKQRSFESVQYHIATVLTAKLPFLHKPELADELLLAKTLQNKSWQFVCQHFGFSGRKQAESICRQRLQQWFQ